MMPPVHRVGTTGSTNEDLHALAVDGAPDGTAMVASTMNRGRGSRGRAWHAAAGGLWLSVLRRPKVPVATGVLSLRVGLALAPVLDQLIRHQVMIKWPNDLLLGDRKLGGILCEMRWQGDRASWVVIGVGINVSNPLPADLSSQATTLAKHAPGISAEAILDLVLAPLRTLNVDAPELNPADLAAYRKRDWLRGRELTNPIAGRVHGIDRSGALEVIAPDGACHRLLDAELALV